MIIVTHLLLPVAASWRDRKAALRGKTFTQARFSFDKIEQRQIFGFAFVVMGVLSLWTLVGRIKTGKERRRTNTDVFYRDR